MGSCLCISVLCVCGGWEVERGGEGFDPSVLAGHARMDMGGRKGVYIGGPWLPLDPQ